MNQAVTTQRARQAYQTAQVEAQDSMTLVVKLYDGMLAFLRAGAESMAAGDRVGSSMAIRRATDIIGELQAVLDLENGAEVAANLDRLYAYCRRRIAEGHAQSDPGALVEVTKLMSPLRDAWSEAAVRQGTVQASP